MSLAYRFGIDSQDLSDLRILELLHIDHAEQFPLIVREFLKQSVYFLVDRVFKDVILIDCRGLRRVVQILCLSPSVLAEIIDQAVSRDRAQPCAH